MAERMAAREVTWAGDSDDDSDGRPGCSLGWLLSWPRDPSQLRSESAGDSCRAYLLTVARMTRVRGPAHLRYAAGPRPRRPAANQAAESCRIRLPRFESESDVSCFRLGSAAAAASPGDTETSAGGPGVTLSSRRICRPYQAGWFQVRLGPGPARAGPDHDS